jgi:hypothetical protein
MTLSYFLIALAGFTFGWIAHSLFIKKKTAEVNAILEECLEKAEKIQKHFGIDKNDSSR